MGGFGIMADDVGYKPVGAVNGRIDKDIEHEQNRSNFEDQMHPLVLVVMMGMITIGAVFMAFLDLLAVKRGSPAKSQNTARKNDHRQFIGMKNFMKFDHKGRQGCHHPNSRQKPKQREDGRKNTAKYMARFRQDYGPYQLFLQVLLHDGVLTYPASFGQEKCYSITPLSDICGDLFTDTGQEIADRSAQGVCQIGHIVGGIENHLRLLPGLHGVRTDPADRF